MARTIESTAETRTMEPGSIWPVSGTYQESPPPAHLREHIVCFWHRPTGAKASATPILPDGCIDLIWTGEQPPIIAGPMTTPMSPAVARHQEIIGVRFRPAAAPALLGASAADLVNQHVKLRDVWCEQEHQPWADATAGDNLSARLEAIAGLIASRLRDARDVDRLVSGAAHWLAAHPSDSLDLLVGRSGLSERQLRRRFEEAIGYGPKKLQRILRLQRLLWLASHSRGARPSLSQLAFAAGYADQPHMTREVLALTGSPPGKLLGGSAPRSAVADLFKTPPR